MYKTKKHNIIIACGGTGGHVFPAKALSSYVKERSISPTILIDNNSYHRFFKKNSDDLDIRIISCSKISNNPLQLLKAFFLILAGFLKSLIIIAQMRPRMVIGFGGYASFPTMLAARALGVKMIIHEQNAVLGKVNKFFAKECYRIATSFSDTKEIENKYIEKLAFVGNPIRKEIKEAAIEYKLPGKNQPFNILVTGGSNGADFLGKNIADAIVRIKKISGRNIKVFHQCNEDSFNYIHKKYIKADIDANIKSFFDDIESKIKESHLVISRAGSSAIFEICYIGKPLVLIPFPFAAKNHQFINAQIIEKQGAGILIKQENFDLINFSKVISDLINNPSNLEKMANNAKNFSGLDASRSFLSLINSSL